MRKATFYGAFLVFAASCSRDLPYMGQPIRPRFDNLAPPTGVKATAISATRIKVTWNDNSSEETDFRIERVPQGSTLYQYANANATQFTDTELQEGTTYTYRVSAIGATVASAPSQPTVATTFSKPLVSTTPITSIGTTTATGGGEVSNSGGTTVLARGVCWSLTATPTVDNNLSLNGDGTGSFTSQLTGLTPNTTYYVRAFATNSVGTAYGNLVSFVTEP